MDYSVFTDQLNSLISSDYGALAFDIIVLTVAMLLIWYLYRKVAKKDMFAVDLDKYTGRYATLKKFGALIAYVVKYMVLFPIYTFLMFAILAMSFFMLSPQYNITSSLFFSIVIISVVRILAYINEDAAQELAKMLPFSLVLSLLLNPSLISYRLPTTAETVNAFSSISQYFVFIIGLELVLRVGSFILSLGRGKNDESQN
ncbi:hypothetical protein J7K41_04335 [Candidatus Micrarchaeota archaeon]|nr:hypothetical protein [Candidatus Micrarchaeota archaeon]